MCFLDLLKSVFIIYRRHFLFLAEWNNLLEKPWLHVFQLITLCHNISRCKLLIKCLIRVHLQFDSHGTTHLPWHTENHHRSILLCQVLNQCRVRIEVDQWSFLLLEGYMKTFKMLVNVRKLLGRKVIERSDPQHHKLGVVLRQNVDHIAQEDLVLFDLWGKAGHCEHFILLVAWRR